MRLLTKRMIATTIDVKKFQFIFPDKILYHPCLQARLSILVCNTEAAFYPNPSSLRFSILQWRKKMFLNGGGGADLPGGIVLFYF